MVEKELVKKQRLASGRTESQLQVSNRLSLANTLGYTCTLSLQILRLLSSTYGTSVVQNNPAWSFRRSKHLENSRSGVFILPGPLVKDGK